MRLRSAFIFIAVISIVFVAAPSGAVSLRNHDAFFGYSRLGSNVFNPNANRSNGINPYVGGLNGWEGALHIHLKPFLGVEGDVAHYGLGANAVVPRTTTVMIGPRVSVKAIGVNLFVHGLLGGEHSANSDSLVPISNGGFTYALGGGVDLPIFPFFAWRFSADYIDAPSITPPGAGKARFNTGLVFRF
jgi:hypothetical protein